MLVPSIRRESRTDDAAARVHIEPARIFLWGIR